MPKSLSSDDSYLVFIVFQLVHQILVVLTLWGFWSRQSLTLDFNLLCRSALWHKSFYWKQSSRTCRSEVLLMLLFMLITVHCILIAQCLQWAVCTRQNQHHMLKFGCTTIETWEKREDNNAYHLYCFFSLVITYLETVTKLFCICGDFVPLFLWRQFEKR